MKKRRTEGRKFWFYVMQNSCYTVGWYSSSPPTSYKDSKAQYYILNWVPARRDAGCQGWRSEFDPQGPHDGKREPMPISYPLMAEPVPCCSPCAQAHTNKRINVMNKLRMMHSPVGREGSREGVILSDRGTAVSRTKKLQAHGKITKPLPQGEAQRGNKATSWSMCRCCYSVQKMSTIAFSPGYSLPEDCPL